jgi:hypothetical protein
MSNRHEKGGIEMKIVQFKNGKYAVRKGNWLTGYEFASRYSPNCWWATSDGPRYYECQTLDEAKRVLAGLTEADFGTPVKDA